MIDCLLDWVDPDNLVRLNGAEADGDYQPANELLTRIEDLKKSKAGPISPRRRTGRMISLSIALARSTSPGLRARFSSRFPV